MNADAATVRQWAQDNGLDVSDKGRVSSDVYYAYDLAHGGAADDILVEAAGDEADSIEATVAPDSIDSAPPPPRQTPDLDQDPAPKRPKGRAGKAIPPKVKVTEAVRKDIGGKTALLLTFPAAAFARRDPICGDVALQIVPGVSGALADIFCESPDVVAFFTSTGGGFVKWLNLAVELQPLIEVMYQHHVAKSIGPQGGGPGQWDGETVPPDESRYHAPAL